MSRAPRLRGCKGCREQFDSRDRPWSQYCSSWCERFGTAELSPLPQDPTPQQIRERAAAERQRGLAEMANRPA